MRVLIADKLSVSARDRLERGRFTVESAPELSGAALTEAIKRFDPEAIVVRSTRIQEEHVLAGDSLGLVVRAGAGVNTIDLRSCAQRGVYVSNCPGRNAVAVAELAVGLLLALDRRIADNVADLRAGRWNKGFYSRAEGIKGRTLGILGMGQIGTEVATRAKAFGMRVVVWCKDLSHERAEELGVTLLESPLAVAKACDVLTVHLALVEATRGIIGREIFAALPQGALFLNTARAELVDQEALLHALDQRGLRAGLDVFAGEPKGKEGTIEDAIAAHPAVYGTHHIGASTTQAQDAVAAEVCRILEVTRSTGRVPNCVNLQARSAADHLLVIRHRDRVGVLAGVLGVLREAEINVEEMDNTIFMGGEAASARIQIHGVPSATMLANLRANNDIFSVLVAKLE